MTYIDETFAKEQYTLLKKFFWKDGPICGFKEYHNFTCPLGFDIDAGPIVLGLSPSGTAFATGAVTYFNDSIICKQILKTREIAGRTVLWDRKSHYALAKRELNLFLLSFKTDKTA